MVRMVKRIFLGLIILLLFACSSNNLSITGNVKEGTEIIKAGRLGNILKDISPAIKYTILIGSDGTAALITSRSFPEIMIIKENGKWNSKTEKLPTVCNIKNIEEICVYTKTSSKENRFSKRLDEFDFLGQSSKNGFYSRKYKELPGK
ncbi:MAG: hypothetical protein P9L97_02805 [Candidatus Tenebribacter davisii]|jgi:hypothetical protein|nr:hypothetical protein [Candidatus Tenebribacter davisii]